MTHTEHVHILFGIGLALAGLFWLGAQIFPASPLRFVWPALLFFIGLFLVIPTETQERTYTPVSTWDTFLSVFPNSFSVWLTTVQKVHVIQHKTAGLCSMIAGGVEGARAAGLLTARGWRWTMPVLAILAGLAVGVHGGTHTHLPRVTEQLHHWIMGAAMAGGGLVHGFATRTGDPHPIGRAVLPALLLVAGLDLMLFYRIH